MRRAPCPGRGAVVRTTPEIYNAHPGPAAGIRRGDASRSVVGARTDATGGPGPPGTAFRSRPGPAPPILRGGFSRASGGDAHATRGGRPDPPGGRPSGAGAVRQPSPSRPAQPSARRPGSSTTPRTTAQDRRIVSPILGRPRDLYVYLPPGYTRAWPTRWSSTSTRPRRRALLRRPDGSSELDAMIARASSRRRSSHAPTGLTSGDNRINDPTRSTSTAWAAGSRTT